jgi:hypothetical protein
LQECSRYASSDTCGEGSTGGGGSTPSTSDEGSTDRDWSGPFPQDQSVQGLGEGTSPGDGSSFIAGAVHQAVHENVLIILGAVVVFSLVSA